MPRSKRQKTEENQPDLKNKNDGDPEKEQEKDVKKKDSSAVMSSPRKSLRSGRHVAAFSSSDNESEEDKSGMTLDVLAQVASETLKKEPKSPKRTPPKKLSLRYIQTLEVLTLEQIQSLSEKTILTLFADINANEMTRNFTYTCFLMPKECQKKFTSFGSEMRAREEMRKHLLKHVAELIDEANDPNRSTKFKFTAEPVHVRKSRLEEKPKRKKKPVIAPGTLAMRVKMPSHDKVPFTSIKETDLKVEAGSTPRIGQQVASGHVDPSRIKKKHGLFTKTAEHHTSSDDTNECMHVTSDETERRIEENEQFIIDLLSRTQPHHDHCYTTIFGKRKGIETMHLRVESSGEEEEDNEQIDVGNDTNYYGSNTTKTKKKKHTHPILFLRHKSPDENVPMVSMEEIIDGSASEEEEEEEGNVSKSGGQKPYPPMPKSDLARRGKVFIPEEYSSGEEEVCDAGTKKKRKLQPIPGTKDAAVDWEPKLALKYIRELKVKKKDENIPLKCKICKDKTFTATATLMYHYRSHAGIKPFVCLICNTTFTRQHSLNYHMLIHNNQSRFTCKDCGRKFRHPSHFKEHLRRHTGETPFQCMDCGLKFKTRNTYKRHLKTRHGKLLTAAGIHTLTREEFQRVRTKPYRYYKSIDEPIPYEMPEIIFSKLKNKVKGSDDSKENISSSNLQEMKVRADGGKNTGEKDEDSDSSLFDSSEEEEEEEENAESEKEVTEEREQKNQTTVTSEQSAYYVPIGIYVKT